VNIVSEPFNFPLIGFVNIARGNHLFPQIGFINLNTANFSSLQAGFINTALGDVNGLQLGFINTAAGDLSGLQLGFVNTANSFAGSQIGFINTTARESQGLQLGFVNTAARAHNGVQIGFVNYAESIENGIPIGFISIVRRGGYRAVELSFTEFYHFNAGLKLGVERFYSTLFAAYNSVTDFDLKYFAAGLGFGSIIRISESFFVNPEVNSLSTFESRGNRQYLSFVPFFGFDINRFFSVTLGPSVTWTRANSDAELRSPNFYITEHRINDNNSIVVGARAALRLRF